MSEDFTRRFVVRVHAVVVEGDAVDDADEQQGPVRAAFGDGGVAVVVYGQEDVGRVCEVWQSGFQGQRVRGLEEEKGHAGAEQDDVRFGVGAQFLVLEVFFPEGDGLEEGSEVEGRSGVWMGVGTLSVSQSDFIVSMSSFMRRTS